jgi:hypothetical protein
LVSTLISLCHRSIGLLAKPSDKDFDDELKDTLSKLVNVYFFETSILFKVASVSAPAIIILMKTIDKLPSKEEFTEIKSETQSQYSRVREGLEIIKAALDDRTARDKSGEDIYG